MRLKYLFILTSFCLFLFSCHKFLDQEPVSTATDQTTWKSDDDVNSAVAGCYSLIRSALNSACSFYTYGDLPTDEFLTSTDGDYLKILQMDWDETVSSTNTYDPKLKLRVYTPFYSAIAQANRCLYFIGKASLNVFSGDDTAQQRARQEKYLAEAYFTRAFCYFYMARVWGGVPLRTSYESDISSDDGIARSPEYQVLNQCIADLEYARKHLDWKDASSSDAAVRADRGAVFALMAHVCAWRGSYDSCNAYCDSVINSGSYSLLSGSNYSKIYNGQSDESIFEISQNATDEAMIANAYSASIGYYSLASPYLPTNTIPIWQINSETLFSLYSDTANDLR